MKVYFDFYDREDHAELGAIECEKNGADFKRLVEAGYSYVERIHAGRYTNLIDTPAEFYKISAGMPVVDDDDDVRQDEREWAEFRRNNAGGE